MEPTVVQAIAGVARRSQRKARWWHHRKQMPHNLIAASYTPPMVTVRRHTRDSRAVMSRVASSVTEDIEMLRREQDRMGSAILALEQAARALEEFARSAPPTAVASSPRGARRRAGGAPAVAGPTTGARTTRRSVAGTSTRAARSSVETRPEAPRTPKPRTPAPRTPASRTALPRTTPPRASRLKPAAAVPARRKRADGQETLSERVEQLLAGEPRKLWSVRDIVGALERDRSVTSQNPDGAMRTLLTRLNRDGRIARAARGQYRSVS